jgi:hypothetical protein
MLAAFIGATLASSCGTPPENPTAPPPVSAVAASDQGAVGASVRPAKLDICHFDATTQTWSPLAVPQAGWPGHESHGDFRVTPENPCPPPPCPCFTAYDARAVLLFEYDCPDLVPNPGYATILENDDLECDPQKTIMANTCKYVNQDYTLLRTDDYRSLTVDQDGTCTDFTKNGATITTTGLTPDQVAACQKVLCDLQ